MTATVVQISEHRPRMCTCGDPLGADDILCDGCIRYAAVNAEYGRKIHLIIEHTGCTAGTAADVLHSLENDPGVV